MNKILQLLEERELYSHLILFKVYLKTRGRIDESYSGSLNKELKELFGNEFNEQMYSDALNYLYSEGYTMYSSAQTLTNNGRRYFENWVREFSTLQEEDKNLLDKKLSEKAKNFLGLANNVITTINSAKKLLELITIN